MATENTTRVSFRLKTDVFNLIEKLSAEKEITPSAFIQQALENSVRKYLPAERQEELKNMEELYTAAQDKAREVFNSGAFDKHFTLTVFHKLMTDPKTRSLYEQVIGTDAYTDGAPKKTPLNMYLGWFIKNAINAEPLLDAAGKPLRKYVKDEPIKSYTLLQVPSASASASARKLPKET